MQVVNKPTAYIYLIVHKSGKFYYGSRLMRSTNDPYDDLFVRYFSSSERVKELIECDGVDSFERYVVYIGDYASCWYWEQLLIKSNIHKPNILNMRYFDVSLHKTVFSTFGRTLSTKGKPKSESTKEKMRKPKTESHKQTMSINQLARGGYGPKEHTEETRMKISAGLMGREQTEDAKRKIGDAHRGKPKPKATCPHCGLIGNKGPMHRFHFDNCKHKHE